MLSGIPNIYTPSIYSNYGKMSFPVDPSSLIYSHFKHVSGVAAPDGTNGISISKLNLLDVLIDRLNQLNLASSTQSSANPVGGVDSLIENLNKQLIEAKSASETTPYLPSPDAEGGALFSLLG